MRQLYQHSSCKIQIIEFSNNTPLDVNLKTIPDMLLQVSKRHMYPKQTTKVRKQYLAILAFHFRR